MTEREVGAMVGEAGKGGVTRYGGTPSRPTLTGKCDCVVGEGMYWALTSLLMASLCEH